MQSTTQAFELRDGDIGHEPGAVPDRQVGTARAVIVDDNQRRSAALAAALKLGGGDLAVIVVAADDPALRSQLLPADLVLLALGGRDVSALGIGAEAVQRNPFTEVVFYCDDPDAPEVASRASVRRSTCRRGWRAAETCWRGGRACGGRRRARRRCPGRRRWRR